MPRILFAGPDRLLDADRQCAWNMTSAVRLRVKNDERLNPVSIPSRFKKHCDIGGENMALCLIRKGQLLKCSYNQLYLNVSYVAKAFIELGLEPLHGVAIIGYNSPEWVMAELGAILAGGVAVCLYNTEDLERRLVLTNTDIVVAETTELVDEVLKIKYKVPSLKKIVQYSMDDAVENNNEEVLSWRRLLGLGIDLDDQSLEKRLSNQAINQCAVISFSPGSEGETKGIMLSHDNITWTSKNLRDHFGWPDGSICLSYLPLSHITIQMFDLWVTLVNHGTLFFAEETEVKENFLDILRLVRPTRFLGVPKVWTDLMNDQKAKEDGKQGFKKKLQKTYQKAGLNKYLHGRNSFFYQLGRVFFFYSAKEDLGFDRCQTFHSCNSSLRYEVLQYFMGLDIEILDSFGSVETSGWTTSNTPENHRPSTQGIALPEVKFRVSEPKEGTGEICIWGRNVMMGILGEKAKTKETLDEEGWLHMGDIGRKANEAWNILGRCCDRLSSLHISSVETHLLRAIPCLSKAFVIRSSVTMAFLSFQTAAEQHRLSPEVLAWLRGSGCRCETLHDVLKGPDAGAMEAIQRGVDVVNCRIVEEELKIKKWTVMPEEEFPLGPLFNIRRGVFMEDNEKLVRRMMD